MSEPCAFIPGRPGAAEPPLAPYRPSQPFGAARGYVRSLTSKGGLVVDLFCQGARFLQEAVEAGRRALGVSVNPALLNAARQGLAAAEPERLTAAFTRLADSPKTDVPLGQHVDSLYRSRCPVCSAPGTAEWFAWHRDRDRPYEKAVRCRSCEKLQVGPVDGDDVALARSFAPRGLPYYYALDRAAPLGHPSRERAAELVACYTPRNLSALMDLSRRVQDLKATEAAQVALKGLLLDCFDRCSRLHPYGEERARPRTLRIPVRYVERNVWHCLENGLSRYREGAPRPSCPEAKDAEALIRGSGEGYALVPCAARDVGRILPPGSADLVLVDPPRPDGVFWALTALWSAWLWRSDEARALRPYLRRRRFDWDWHWRALRDALTEVGPRLAEHARMVTLFQTDDRSMLVSVCLAAANAGYRLRGWGYAPEAGYRLTWSWDGSWQSDADSADEARSTMALEIAETVTDTLRLRGEPTHERFLHAAAYARLARRGLLTFPEPSGAEDTTTHLVEEAFAASFPTSAMVRLDEEPEDREAQWWLQAPPAKTETLADRVEVLVRELLPQRPMWDESELVDAVYARFSGPLTPDLTLVRTCLSSYGTCENAQVRLREEDVPGQRRLEVAAVRRDLLDLGSQLGFHPSAGGVWDARWLADGRLAFVFAVSATAVMTPWLLADHATPTDGQKCLVVPGGRAALIHLKLQRDPRLAEAVESGAWQFIKFRHLRRLIGEQDLDRQAFEIVVGLDPVAEQEHAQLSLL